MATEIEEEDLSPPQLSSNFAKEFFKPSLSSSPATLKASNNNKTTTFTTKNGTSSNHTGNHTITQNNNPNTIKPFSTPRPLLSTGLTESSRRFRTTYRSRGAPSALKAGRVIGKDLTNLQRQNDEETQPEMKKQTELDLDYNNSNNNSSNNSQNTSDKQDDYNNSNNNSSNNSQNPSDKQDDHNQQEQQKTPSPREENRQHHQVVRVAPLRPNHHQQLQLQQSQQKQIQQQQQQRSPQDIDRQQQYQPRREEKEEQLPKQVETDKNANPDKPQKPKGGIMLVTVNKKKYFKGRKLGKGGSSTVYSITDKEGMHYALKRVELGEHDYESYRSFINEIKLLERLRGQERIIQLYDYEVDEPQKKLIMIIELGEIDLNSLLQERSGKQVSLNFIRHTWEQMLEAVNVIHEAGIVHTDLKPANFVLVKGSLKLIDFGIGQVIPDETANIQRDTQVGTANYMPPEALRPEFQDPHGDYKMKLGRPADVWSLGCILYQMVYGITPFSHMKNLQQKMQAIANEDTQISFPEYTVPIDKKAGKKLDHLATRVEEDLIRVLKGCLQFRRALRPTIPQLYMDPFLRKEQSSESLQLSPTLISEIVSATCRWNANRAASKSSSLSASKRDSLKTDIPPKSEQDLFIEKIMQQITSRKE